MLICPGLAEDSTCHRPAFLVAVTNIACPELFSQRRNETRQKPFVMFEANNMTFALLTNAVVKFKNLLTNTSNCYLLNQYM